VGLLNISVKGEYALHAIFDLACQHRGEPVKIADIAKRQNIPQKFLELILAGLKQGGFVESRRGAEGGYLLSRPAESITIGQVLRFMEVKGGHANGRQRLDSPFADLWSDVDTAVSRVIDNTSFADLVRGHHDRQRQYVPNWEI
jgi:Rrf2 family transcriptional regulator, cysteine metabolism repressor